MSSEKASTEMASQENEEALLEAARYDDIDDVKIIVSAGVSLDSKDSQERIALHMATANRCLDVVEFLTSSGVDLNASNVEKYTLWALQLKDFLLVVR